MLIDDGAVTAWMPEDFLDESTYGFELAEGRELTVSPYGLHPAADLEAAVARRWADGKRAVASLDPTATVREVVEAATVAGFPAALGFVTVKSAEIAMHRGLALVRLGPERGLEIEHEVEGAAAADPSALEAFFRHVLASAWPLSSPTPPNVPPGYAARLLGHIGVVLPSDARARGDYRFQSPVTPTRFGILSGKMPPRRYPLGYFSSEDRVVVEASQSDPHSGSGVRGTEWVERVRRERDAVAVGAQSLAPGLHDVHHVRLAELTSSADPGAADARFISVFAATPADNAAELDALWVRVLVTCRPGEHG